MDKNKTHVTLLIDKSSSMNSCRAEAQSGIDSFIAEQKGVGKCTLTIIEFDSKYRIVCNGVDIEDFEGYTLSPSGMTNLTDAFGRGIDETGDYLSSIEEDKRPGLVLFGIITDGEETVRPSEYTQDLVKQKVETQKSEFSWQFTFLGANQDAFTSAGGFGIDKASVASYSVNNSLAAFEGASKNFVRMRQARANNKEVKSFYTSQELEAMNS